jgi:regulator of sigma E protease
MNTMIFLAVLFIIVLAHELGHYLFARLFKVGIKTFSIGFGPPLIKKSVGKTIYQLALLPLGGYVSMAGEGYKKDNPDDVHFSEQEKYYSKSRWQRLLIVFAGPFANFLFAFLIMPIVFMLGVANPNFDPSKEKPIIEEVISGSSAATSGIKPGDTIIKINSINNPNIEEVFFTINSNCNNSVFLKVKRENKILSINVVPKQDGGMCRMGVKFYMLQAPTVRYSGMEAVKQGTKATFKVFHSFFTGLSMMSSGQIAPKDAIGGPIQMVNLTAIFSKMGFSMLLFYVALLNINLGIVNLLPILPLDGGHIFTIMLEYMGLGKFVNKYRNAMALVGMILIMALMFFAIFNDIVKFFVR